MVILCATAQATCAQAGQPYLVSELNAGNIWRIEDTNNDGDALDIGERTLWGNGFASLVGLDSRDGTVYGVEEGLISGSNEIVKLVDVNGDGDALDVGERVVWATGLNDPRDVASDAAGNFYVSDFGSNEVWRLVDANGDGDALDVGEKTLFAEQIGGAEMLLPWEGGLLITAFSTGEVILLDDANNDGDALDVGENQAIVTGVTNALGMLSDNNGGLYVASFGDAAVYHATDNNGDSDFLDVVEVLSYADAVFGSLSAPWSMADYSAGFLLTDFVDGEVLLTSDNNGDGDALDLGEVTLFADGFSLPVDLVPLVEAYNADYDNDGDVDGADFLKWQRGESPAPLSAFDLNLWETQYGTTASLIAAATTVPEPDCAALLLIAFTAMSFPGFRVAKSSW